jgi:SET domain-containing protein|tara:strand:+ start:209 stop:553 length:345 start_codon:yes stop_codon:yes gene_type:complete
MKPYFETIKYRPLPKEVRLGFSKIHDLGVFAKEKIKRGSNLGISHIQIGKELFRTPLGGFINHSDDPNCTKSMARITNAADLSTRTDYKIWRLFTLDEIKEGEELTLTYTFYKI